MKWVSIMGVTAFLVILAMFEWSNMKANMKREKIAFAALTSLGWGLAVLLLFYPEMPGPTQWINAIYQPLGKYFEK
jgi:multisubunit Na+/H+ antiporter MnhB subunit